MVTHTMSPVIQVDDYYPFGLSFNSYQRMDQKENPYLFNQGTGDKTFKTERIKDLGFNLDLTKFRMYDYQLGRFWQVDPKADHAGQEIWSPYNFAFNNPIRYNDPEGDCIPCLVTKLTIKYGTIMASMNSSSPTAAMTRISTDKSTLVPENVQGANNFSMVDNKTLGKVNDSKILTDAVAENTKTLTNEVSKDGLGAAKALGDGLMLTGVGAPAGGAISTVATVLNEGRQVALEGKSIPDAGKDLAVEGVINKTFSGLGKAAKSTMKHSEAGKETFDKAVDAHSFGFSKLFQWVSDKIQGDQTVTDEH